MKKILFVIGVLSLTFGLYAQESDESVAVIDPSGKKPVRAPWESGVLMNHQTGLVAPARTLEMLIQHRFSTIENGKTDAWGIMAPGANVRLGLNYSIMKNLMIGYGMNTGIIHDFQAKYAMLNQTRDGSTPLSLTLYGNMGLDGQEDEDYGDNYQFSDRFSYFGEMIIGRKVTDALSIQASGNYSHYNSVELNQDHDKIGVSAAARYKFSPQSSLMVEWGLPLTIQGISEQAEAPVSNYHLSIGVEISTSTHAFHIFVTNAMSMMPQEMYSNNDFLFDKNGIRFGFNITRLWNL